MLKLLSLACMAMIAAIGLLPMSASAGTTRPCGDGYIELNTNIPFIGQCIKKTADPNSQEPTAGNSFGLLLGGLMRIAMTAVLIIAFMAVLVGGVMIAAGGATNEDSVKKGKTLIKGVIFGILLLGVSGIILNVINPNFFKNRNEPASGGATAPPVGQSQQGG